MSGLIQESKMAVEWSPPVHLCSIPVLLCISCVALNKLLKSSILTFKLRTASSRVPTLQDPFMQNISKEHYQYPDEGTLGLIKLKHP